jgi:ABC-type transporter Mla subunit MlaD
VLRNPNNRSIAANPVLIGAATVLLVVVAVFLSYNANKGLPFVPMYEVDAHVPNAQGLIEGNDVRIGGARVGVVSKITSEQHDDGGVGAILHLKIETSQNDLPVDSTILVRPRSPLGLKYVEITRGRARDTIANNGDVPLSAAKVTPVEIDDWFNMFDEPTRTASQGNLREFGGGFAGRGRDLNTTFRELLPLVEAAEPALALLADPDTGFDRLFPAFEQAATEVAPVAQTQADMWSALATTFTAWAGVSESLKQSITLGVPALETATRELPAQGPFVVDSTELFKRLRPAFVDLAAAAPGLSQAFGEGAVALERAPELNARFVRTFEATEAFALDPRTRPGFRRIARFASLLEPLVSYIAPAQTRCGYLAGLFHNVSLALSESDSIGSFLRASVMLLPQVPGSEAGPAAAPANGPEPPPDTDPIELSLIDDSFLHSNPLPNTTSPGQSPVECEPGNESGSASQGGHYLPEQQVVGNVPGDQGTFTYKGQRLDP